jgi:uncharacterized protein
MKSPLDLRFRFEELSFDGRAFEGEIPADDVREAIEGLAGPLGYRTEGNLSVSGTAYPTSTREVIVTGEVSGTVSFECARCLSTRSLPVAMHFDHALIKGSAADADGEGGIELDETALDEPDTVPFDGENIDLRAVLREDLVLELPMNPTCDDMPETTCEAPTGPRVAGTPPPETEAEAAGIDPRWAPLLALKNKLD